MKTLKSLLFVAVIFGLAIASALSGRDDTYQAVKAASGDGPRFTVRMFNTASDSVGQSRLTVQVGFVHDALQFIKIGKSLFQAEYDVNVILMDEDGAEVARESWSGSVEVGSFDATNSTTDLVSTVGELIVPAGEYQTRVELFDHETRRMGAEEGRVVVQDLVGDRVTASDIMFVSSISFLDKQVAHKDAAPSEQPDIYAYIEVYNVPATDSFGVSFKVSNLSGDLLLEEIKYLASAGRITKTYLALDEETESNVEVTADIAYDDTTVVRQQKLTPTRPGGGSIFDDLDLAIKQMIYVTDQSTIQEMLALDKNEKIAAFQEFWEQRDPTQGTRENEYMNEYYGRIAYATKEFETYKPGWQTERGYIFVKLGPPSYVDEPFAQEWNYGNRRTYVIWHYTRLNRRVVFQVLYDEYRIANRMEIFDLLSVDGIIR